MTVLALLALFAPFAGKAHSSKEDMPIAEGKFQPNWESLQQYECPEWFNEEDYGQLKLIRDQWI